MAGLRRSAELFRAFRIVRPLRRSLYRISIEQNCVRARQPHLKAPRIYPASCNTWF